MNPRFTRTAVTMIAAAAYCAGLTGLWAEEPPTPPQPTDLSTWEGWMTVMQEEEADTNSAESGSAVGPVPVSSPVLTTDPAAVEAAEALIQDEPAVDSHQTILQRISHQTFSRFGYLQNREQQPKAAVAATPQNAPVQTQNPPQRLVQRPQTVAAVQTQTVDDGQYVTIRVPRASVHQAPQTQQVTQQQPSAPQMFLRPAQPPQAAPQVAQVTTVSRPQTIQPQLQTVLTQPQNVIGTASFSNTQTQGSCAADGACCPTDGCNDCEDPCCNNCYQCCEPEHLFEVGVEALFLQGSLDGASSSVTAFNAVGTPVASVTSNSSDDSELAGAPRIWLGVGRGCWGVRGRYFDLQAGDHDFGNPGTLPNALGFSRQFRAYTADIEVTRKFCLNDCGGLFSLGARRARLDSSTHATLVSAVAGDIVQGTANTFREFDGTGVTVGLQGNKPIGNPCHGLSLFCGARASFLWGDARAASGTTTSASNFLGATSDRQFAAAGTDEAEMTITELQLGLQHSRKLECMPVVAFFRVAAEWQRWSDQSDLLTSANSTSAIVPGASVIANANTGAQTLDLVGLVLAAGITY